MSKDYNLTKMIGLDIYLLSLSKEEHSKIEHNIKPLKNRSCPLICWDIIQMNLSETLNDFRRKN